MFSPEIEFTSLVSEYRRLVDKYAKTATDVSTVPASSTASEVFVEDLQTVQLASPFNVANWSRGSCLEASVPAQLEPEPKLNAGSSLESSLSRILDGLKDQSPTQQQQQQSDKNNNSWFLKLASLEYAKSLARFSSSEGLEKDLSLRNTTSSSSLDTIARALGAMEWNKTQKRKDSGDCSLDCEINRALPVKKQRLVWTEDLHKRFEDAVNKLGIGKAFPKAILEEMNIEGLTRENIASHLQKYRKYQERQQANLKKATDNPADSGNPVEDESKQISPVADSGN
eukprot:g8311.t1